MGPDGDCAGPPGRDAPGSLGANSISVDRAITARPPAQLAVGLPGAWRSDWRVGPGTRGRCVAKPVGAVELSSDGVGVVPPEWAGRCCSPWTLDAHRSRGSLLQRKRAAGQCAGSGPDLAPQPSGQRIAVTRATSDDTGRRDCA